MLAIRKLVYRALPKPLKELDELPHLLHLLHTEAPLLAEDPKLLPQLIRLLPPEECIKEALAVMNYGKNHAIDESINMACTLAVMHNFPFFEAMLKQAPALKISTQTGLINTLIYGLQNALPELVDYILCHPQLVLEERLIEAVCFNGTIAQFSTLVQRFHLKENTRPIIQFLNNQAEDRYEKIIPMLRSQGYDLSELFKEHSSLEKHLGLNG